MATDTAPTNTEVHVERATTRDGEGIAALINFWAAQGQMLPRTLGETYENLRDFFVVRQDGRVIGCAALHITWSDLAELKSLAVEESTQSRGIGAALVRACVEEGRALGLDRLFALTYRPGFFERLDWEQADVMNLPRKVWNECYRCPKFPGCDEIAMILDLKPADAAS
ncbi:MAG: N-acetyltransferase [Chloroflexi bacterium]|nr:N-acetyltransferase [Chloroflexota bacterium]MDA1240968.1 N-acetyltransferase [Chloroflexota bacterium]MQC48262.1 N-acetyltransferase [Chloroflexota bacterium]